MEDIHNDIYVTIAICSRSRRKYLERLVVNIQDKIIGCSYEILVIEETDRPNEINGVKYIAHPILRRGIAFSRNLALGNASSQLIVFLDDDCLVTDEWLNKIIAPFEDASVAGVQGGVTVPSWSNGIGWAESLLGFPGGGISRVALAKGKWQATKEISTLNCAYRKSSIEKAGGFDERLKKGGEDYVLAKKVCQSGRCLFVPEALVYHRARGNLVSVWRWFVRRGRAEASVIRAKVQKNITLLSLLRSSFTVKLFFFLFLIMFFPDHALLIFAIGALGYILIQYIRYYRPYRLSKAPIAGILVLPIVKLIMDIGMDWGRLTGLFID